MQGEVHHSDGALGGSRDVAMSFCGWAFPWPGVPP
jgi:hypothetical protein